VTWFLNTFLGVVRKIITKMSKFFLAKSFDHLPKAKKDLQISSRQTVVSVIETRGVHGYLFPYLHLAVALIRKLKGE